MTVHRDYANKSCPGDYLYNRHGEIAAEVNKRLTPSTPTPVFKPYTVKITTSELNIRKGAGTNFAIVGYIKDRGIYTIVQQKETWGKLKSGAGWISLDYTERV
jgi:uncharacterized protein YgiM (DUF1202 family)